MRIEIAGVSSTQSINPQTDRAMQAIRRWSHLLDKAFRVPGTKMRFGWDPILGLIPGLGDVSTGLFSLLILIQAFRLQIPGIIRARMILNSLIDVAAGAVPLIGDVFDFAWKSNTLNLSLLEKHAGAGIRPRATDWAFVLGVCSTGLAIIIVPIILLALLIHRLQEWLPGKPLWSFL